MEQDDAISFLDEPITKWWQWLAVFLPFVLFFEIFLVDLLYDQLYELILLLFVFTIIGFFMVIILGVTTGLPSWAYPSMGIFIGLIGFYIYLFLPTYPHHSGIESGLQSVVFVDALKICLFLGTNYLLSILLTGLAALIRSLNKMAFRWHQGVLWSTFLFYCSVLVIPLVNLFSVNSEIILVSLQYVILELGILLFLRLSKPGQRYLIMIVSVVVTNILYAISVRGLHPHESFNGMVISNWNNKLLIVVQGLFIVALIALPATFEYLRSRGYIIGKEELVAE